MKIISILNAAFFLGVTLLRAQVIPDGATNTLSNVTNNLTGTNAPAVRKRVIEPL